MKRLHVFVLLLLTFLLMYQIGLADNLTFEDYLYTVLENDKIEIVRYTGEAESLIIPKTMDGYDVISIGTNAFSRNETLKEVVIPEAVTAIGNYAFAECTNIQSVSLPEGLGSLGDLVFQGDVKLQNIILPDGIVHIGINPFDRCDSLTEIVFSGDNPYYFTEEGVLFDRRNTTLTAYPAGKTDTEYVIPEWVTEIALAAFSENNYLKEITIQDAVAVMNGNPFCGCLSLTKINISLFNRMFEMHSGALYNTHELELIAYLWGSDADSYTVQRGTRSIGQESFYKHAELKKINLPQTVVTIKDAAFAESGLTSINIPDSVISLGNNTFSGCPDLKNVTLPSGLTWLGRYVFSECTALKSISYPKGLDSIGEGAFYQCTSLSELKFPENLHFIGDFAFMECSGLTSVEFPDQLYSIGRGAFYGIEDLTAILTPGTLAEDWAIQNEIRYKRKNVTYMDDTFI
ncbi:MAG: leucine-rich repeat domain-containing protein [Anaerolineaceae bacterium]|nr:leucine-rich repeat domain-containing protein [Anaerolineaceae bacterium]